MPSTPITDYAFEELTEGSGRGVIAQDGQPSEAYRVFKIAWTDLANFIFALKGGWRSINDSTWTYYTPSPHPDWLNMYCSRVEYEGLGLPSYDAGTEESSPEYVGATGKSSWEYAKVTAVYTTATIDHGAADPMAIVEEEFDFGTELITLPEGTMKVSGGDTINVPLQLRLQTLTYIVRMPALPKLPGGSINTVMGLIGRMNSSNFGGAAAGHMLFLGMRAGRKGSSIIPTENPLGGTVAGSNTLDAGSRWDVTLKFAYRDRLKWNEAYIPGVGKATITFADGSPLYESANLNILKPNGT